MWNRHIACEQGHDRTAQLRLNNRADFNMCNENGVSPLYTACEHGHERTVKLLLRKGADVK